MLLNEIVTLRLPIPCLLKGWIYTINSLIFINESVAFKTSLIPLNESVTKVTSPIPLK